MLKAEFPKDHDRKEQSQVREPGINILPSRDGRCLCKAGVERMGVHTDLLRSVRGRRLVSGSKKDGYKGSHFLFLGADLTSSRLTV